MALAVPRRARARGNGRGSRGAGGERRGLIWGSRLAGEATAPNYTTYRFVLFPPSSPISPAPASFLRSPPSLAVPASTAPQPPRGRPPSPSLQIRAPNLDGRLSPMLADPEQAVPSESLCRPKQDDAPEPLAVRSSTGISAPSPRKLRPVSRQARRPDGTPLLQRVEDVFEELISKIADVEFDLPPALKEWKRSYYVPIKRSFSIIIFLSFIKMYISPRDALKMMAFSVPVPLLLDPQLLAAKIANVVRMKYGHLSRERMLFSCCSSECKCDDTCANKSFQHRPLKKTRLITTEKCGSGLVAEDEIKKGEFVIEYVGEVIDDRTCEQRLWKMRRQGHTNFYLCEVSSNMIIDATNKGNMSRFINHSCEPNTEMQKWSVDGETRVGIFALRNIKKGEELTYDYKYVACWVYEFDQETKIHTLQFCDYSLEKFNLKEEEWHFLPVGDESDG
ncbi:hypothetical protein EJB05_00825, partial [Eragrostis curvula]